MANGTNQLVVYCLKGLYSSLKERMTKHPSAHQHQKSGRENHVCFQRISRLGQRG